MPVPVRMRVRTVAMTYVDGRQTQVVVTGGTNGSSGSTPMREHMPGAVGGGLGVRSRVAVASARQPERG